MPPWRAELTSIDNAVPMIIFKPDGTVVQVNKLFLAAMGYQKDEVIGKHHKYFVTHNTLPVTLIAAIGNCLMKGGQLAIILSVSARMAT